MPPADSSGPQPLGDLIGKIVKKARPSARSLKGRKLAQLALEQNLGARSSRASVASVKVGVVTIETDSTVLFQELEGFQKAALIEAFRTAGLNVREIRVKLVASQ